MNTHKLIAFKISCAISHTAFLHCATANAGFSKNLSSSPFPDVSSVSSSDCGMVKYANFTSSLEAGSSTIVETILNTLCITAITAPFAVSDRKAKGTK